MMNWDWGQMMNWNWGWGGMMGGGLGMIAFWVLVIALVIWAVRGLTENSRQSQPPAGTPGGERPTPLEILQARYARGEVSRDEYEAIRRDLQSP